MNKDVEERMRFDQRQILTPDHEASRAVHKGNNPNACIDTEH